MRRSVAIPVALLTAWTITHRTAWAKTVVVNPGDSIQAAVNGASAGDTILVKPGVYHEGAPGDLNAVTVTKAGIQLVAMSSPNQPVVLESLSGQSFGFWVSPSDSAAGGPEGDPERPPCATSGARLDGFTLRGFTLSNFGGHGAHLACVDDFVIAGNVASGNGIYGLFPVLSKRGVLTNNTAENTAQDAAIYVGQSEQVVVEGNVARGSLIGIEVENSNNCVVTNNDIYGNTVGLLVDVLPNLALKAQQTTVLSGNHVHDNNSPNTATGDNAALLPGIGIFLIGADTTTITGNVVTENQLSGIAVLSFCTTAALSGLGCTGIDIDPFPDGNRIVGNTVTGNATVPFPDPAVDALRADLSWDGSGTNNCWSGNRFGTSVPSPLPACQ
jgi:parallel beta-helix repeat protein